MLKTNSKEVRKAVEDKIIEDTLDYVMESFQYIKENPTNNGYTKDVQDLIVSVYNEFQTISDKKEKEMKSLCKQLIIAKCKAEKGEFNAKAFEEWCSGLPSIINCDYYVACKAKRLVQLWLDETDEEMNKYSESQAGKLITSLMYREITR